MRRTCAGFTTGAAVIVVTIDGCSRSSATLVGRLVGYPATGSLGYRGEPVRERQMIP